jgi:antitoxin CptB
LTVGVPSRLRWRCRRGTQELDLILGGFLEAHYVGLDATERAAFEALLHCEDDRLQDWLLGSGVPEREDLRAIVERIRRSL